MSSTLETAIADMIPKIVQHGLVVFVGAGVSADAPACVPGWFGVNSMVLDALKQRVTGYLDRDPEWLDSVIKGIVSRRDAHCFPPEYQAQIMEEQCGENYFYALTSLDLTQRNRTHSAIAELARAGHLRAIVTTNFDRLIEAALDAEKVDYESFIDLDGFKHACNSHLTTRKAQPLPILKIHGSVESANSMIDTLQQRLNGRSELLADLLVELLGHCVVLYAGFSAADLNHNPDYIGLRRAAVHSPGAVFIRHPGSKIEVGAASLLKAYSGKAYEVAAALNDFFPPLLASLGLDIPTDPSIVDTDPRGTLTRNLKVWVESLQPYEAINVMAALLDAGGAEDAAWVIRRRAGRWRNPSDSIGEHYARYQYNYAHHCVQSGEMLDEETSKNFLRSESTMPQALAGFALWNLYRAQPDDFSLFLLTPDERVLRSTDARIDGDITFVFAQAAVIYRMSNSLAYIIEAGNRQFQVGDVPRACKLWAAAARLAAHTGDTNTTFGLFDHCQYWINYLGDEITQAELYLAQAIATFALGSADSAVHNLQQAMPTLRRYQRWPLLIEALIEGFRYYVAIGMASDATVLLDEIGQRIGKGYEIYHPHVGIAVADYHLSVGQGERARRELFKVRPVAEQSRNEWALTTIDGRLNGNNESTGEI